MPDEKPIIDFRNKILQGNALDIAKLKLLEAEIGVTVEEQRQGQGTLFI